MKSRRLAALAITVGVFGACSGTGVPAASPAALPTASTAAGTAPTASATAPASPSPSASPSAAVAKTSPIPGAADSKVTVQLVAARTSWTPKTLKAPAGKVWHVKIDDRDGAPEHHNFTLATGKTFEERIFQVPNFFTGTHTFDIPAFPAGNYLFICTIHPDAMTGTLTLE
jgi:plastocyanin